MHSSAQPLPQELQSEEPKEAPEKTGAVWGFPSQEWSVYAVKLLSLLDLSIKSTEAKAIIDFREASRLQNKRLEMMPSDPVD